jgi:hypothetical protein
MTALNTEQLGLALYEVVVKFHKYLESFLKCTIIHSAVNQDKNAQSSVMQISQDQLPHLKECGLQHAI